MSVDFVIDLLSGATAGAVGKILFHPIDTCKSQVQAAGSSVSSAVGAFRQTLAKGGVLGLYRGIGAVLIGGTPATMIYLTSYETIKKEMTLISNTSSIKIPDYAIHFSCGMAAEAISCIVFVPVDVVKERMQVYQTFDKTPSNAGLIYRNSWDSFRKILSKEGVGGIYRGYGATLLSFGPFSALYFVGYEKAKTVVATTQKKDIEDLTFWEVLTASAMGGSAAAWITTPLDLVKLRMQIERGIGKVHRSHNMGNMLRDIHAKNGITGLFKGASARVMAYAPCAAVSMAVFESCKKFWVDIINR